MVSAYRAEPHISHPGRPHVHRLGRNFPACTTMQIKFTQCREPSQSTSRWESTAPLHAAIFSARLGCASCVNGLLFKQQGLAIAARPAIRQIVLQPAAAEQRRPADITRIILQLNRSLPSGERLHKQMRTAVHPQGILRPLKGPWLSCSVSAARG